jgi:Zn-dependent protease/tetratricopeptide (TPR) repeat protein
MAMSFRLFGVDVEIQFGFWIIAFLLGMPLLQDPTRSKATIVVWMAVVLVSVLVHEFGHAFAIRRHRIEPSIALHWMGGTTAWRAILPLGRRSLAFISLAGPLAGFAFAAVLYVAFVALRHFNVLLPPLGQFALGQLLFVNVFWGAVNLIPVLPFDGGHVLEHALGPKRIRLTAAISFVTAAAVVVYCLTTRNLWAAMIFGMGGLQSYRRFAASAPQPMRAARRAEPREDAPSGSVATALRRARAALDDEELSRAMLLAEQVLAGTTDPSEPATRPPPSAALEALEIIGWAHVLSGRPNAAAETLEAAQRLGSPDAALVGSVLLGVGKRAEARRALEAARASGDQRKEVAGPLIQILIEAREIPRAAAIALDIADSLSGDDLRRMGAIAFEHGSFDWSARLYEAIFRRNTRADDAYEAARALAKDRQTQRAIELLQRAVDAGFSDRARFWSDQALDALKAEGHLEAVLPKP